MNKSITFKDFEAEWRAARERLTALEGDSNFPGLSPYDRIYALGDEYTAIVRAHDLAAGRDKIRVWWRFVGFVELDDMPASALIRLAEIKHMAQRWIDGIIEHLPPSTSDRWRT